MCVIFKNSLYKKVLNICRWQIMYYIPVGIYIFAAVAFVIFAGGEPQTFDSKKYKTKFCFLW